VDTVSSCGRSSLTSRYQIFKEQPAGSPAHTRGWNDESEIIGESIAAFTSFGKCRRRLSRAFSCGSIPGMDCVVLGYGGMMPMPQRLTTSVLVRRDGRMLMFDAGEGIQLSLKRGGLGIRGLDLVAITHLHADHVLGLPGVMMFRAQCEDPGPLAIVGPPGVERFVRHTLEDLKYRLNYALEFTEWSPAAGPVAREWNGCALSWAPLDHSAFCLGYRIEEAVRPGRFDVARADAAGVPAGPLRGRLQAGEPASLPDGRVVRPEDVLGAPRRGRVVAFATDTRPCPGLEQVCAGADLAFVEGMFANVHADEAEAKRHMTAAEAAAAVARAGASRLVLVHVSPRYSFEDEKVLCAEARAHFPNAEIAAQLAAFEVPLPD
jgi:ribonuclease Z